VKRPRTVKRVGDREKTGGNVGCNERHKKEKRNDHKAVGMTL